MIGEAGTGISRQGTELSQRLLTYNRNYSGPLRFKTHNIRKWELQFGGKPKLGYLSIIAGRCIPVLRSDGELLHAADYSIVPFISDRLDIVNLYDITPWTEPRSYQSTMLQAIMWATCVPALLSARKIVVATEYVKKAVMERFEKDEDDITKIHCGVDTDFWIPLRIGQHERSVLVIGADYPRKNLVRIVEACGLLENVTLRIVGNWRFENVRKQVHETASKLGVKVVYLGTINDHQLRNEYNRATVVCSASMDEGFGLTPVEGMSCGTIPVISDIPPHREVCGTVGIYFDPNSKDSIANGIERGLEVNGHEKIAWQTARDRALLYSWENIVPKWISLYRSLCE